MISKVGSRDQAWAFVNQMFAESEAYRQFLMAKIPRLAEQAAKGPVTDLRSIVDWSEIPVSNKENFYGLHSLKAMIPSSNRNKIFSYTRSSGTTSFGSDKVPAKGFFWPEMKAPTSEFAEEFGILLRQVIADSDESTLLIVGLSLGSWAGGEQMSFSSRISALELGQSLVVFSPGNNHEEILEAIQVHGSDFGKVIIACCPSAIYYLMRMADEKQIAFPLEKITFLVTGEPFAEEYRVQLQKRAGKRSGNVMCSLYSSADTGVLGVESAHLITLRQRILQNPAIAERLELEGGSLPNFFHLNSKDRYYECENGDLLVSLWQGLPLMRYNLKDKVQLFAWSEITTAMIETAQTDRERKLWKLLSTYQLPDVVAVYGRSNGCLFLCGSNIFDTMLSEMVLISEVLKGMTTGHFVVWVGVSPGGQQQLHWMIEKAPGAQIDAEAISEKLCLEFADILGRLQPEFKDDYEKFYKNTTQASERIFQFNFCEAGQVQKHPRYLTGVGKKKLIQNAKPF